MKHAKRTRPFYYACAAKATEVCFFEARREFDNSLFQLQIFINEIYFFVVGFVLCFKILVVDEVL